MSASGDEEEGHALVNFTSALPRWSGDDHVEKINAQDFLDLGVFSSIFVCLRGNSYDARELVHRLSS